MSVTIFKNIAIYQNEIGTIEQATFWYKGEKHISQNVGDAKKLITRFTNMDSCLKVQIVSCSGDSYWYKDFIGKQFLVKQCPHLENKFYIIKEIVEGRLINISPSKKYWGNSFEFNAKKDSGCYIDKVDAVEIDKLIPEFKVGDLVRVKSYENLFMQKQLIEDMRAEGFQIESNVYNIKSIKGDVVSLYDCAYAVRIDNLLRIK